MPMRGVVFDLDETLLDRRRTLDVYARSLHADFSTAATLDLDRFLEEFHCADDDGRTPRTQFALTLATRCFSRAVPADIAAHIAANAWRAPLLFEGVVALLTRLRAEDWRLGIVTNGSVRSQSAKLRNSGLRELVQHCLISEEVAVRKPEAAIFEKIVSALDLDVHRSWFVGDNPRADIWGASQYGFHTLWIENRTPWPDDLPRCYDIRLGSIADCYAALRKAAA